MVTDPKLSRSAASHDARKKVKRPERHGQPIEVSTLSQVRDGQKRPLPQPDPEDMICPECGFEGWPWQTSCPHCQHDLAPRGATIPGKQPKE